MKTFFSPKAYPWTQDGGFFFRGYFIAEDHCLRGAEAIAYLKKRFSEQTSAAVLRSLNGCFSLIWERESDILFAVDRLRSLPLFYSVVDGALWIGDDAASLADALPQWTIDEVSAEEFISTEIFVSGANTLLKELRQVQASEYCLFQLNGAQLSTQSYFHAEHGNFFDDTDMDNLRREFMAAYTKTGKSLVKALNGRTAVLPLSGGADSRMIAALLKQEGYSRVICYTYGREGNPESEISRKVAESMGFTWYMVPYTAKMWENLRSNPELISYDRLGFAFTSTPHLQDFPAVKYLKEHGLLPEDSVFVPGHSGDLLAGSHITGEFLAQSLSHETFLRTIVQKFYNSSPSHALMQRIAARFPKLPSQDMEGLASQSEWFNTQERQSKFIVNSVRVYEHFGYEWLIPLWDNDQFDFWKRVSLPWRFQRKLYFQIVDSKLPSTNDVTAVGKLADRVRRIPGIRQIPRRTTRFFRYWYSPLNIEHLFPARDHFKEVFLGSSTFSTQTISSQRHLKWLRKKCDSRKG